MSIDQPSFGDITVTPEDFNKRMVLRLGEQQFLIENLVLGQEALSRALQETRKELVALKEENMALRESLAGCKGSEEPVLNLEKIQ